MPIGASRTSDRPRRNASHACESAVAASGVTALIMGMSFANSPDRSSDRSSSSMFGSTGERPLRWKTFGTSTQ